MKRKEREDSPIAIVGMACRFPKADGIGPLLQALEAGFNACDVVPADRWDADRYYSKNETSKGKAYVRRGHFVNQNVKAFDANFFGISPREAENMDPQQRLMLEVVWEAFENCGRDLPAFAGKNVGVYVGGFMLDHMITQMAFSNRSQINQHSAAGMMMTMLSNRVSHTFDLRGPSLSMDTACSSSLVAFHFACQDVWRGACEMAVVGGCNVMMRPEYPMGMCKGHFLSRDGESKSFDSRGDGYGRGEGAGALLLKPLEKAVEDGDPILATVLASGTNQDGRTAGISLPNGEAQKELIEQVCQEYGIAPSSVDYVECHGTGTAIGDPTECQAIGETYGRGRCGDDRVVVGSIKSNIGHLEAAAGVAGVIKAVLTLQLRKAFPLGNLQTPHPEIPIEELGLRLSDRCIPLGQDGASIRAAINSFGYGGSNAHVILESYQASVSATRQDDPEEQLERPNAFPLALPVSGRSEKALCESARQLATWLSDSPDESLEDVIYTSAFRRAHLSHRGVAMGRSRAEVVAALEALAEGQEDQFAVRDSKPFQGHDRPVFVFTGMGPQWWAMGQHLYETQPLYRSKVEEADALFREIAGFSILNEMLKSESESEVQRTIYAQPANFVLQLGVYELLLASGVTPGLVVGHSVGELGAAYAAGVLSLEDALRVSYHRSQLQAEAAGLGGMLAVGLGKEPALERIADFKNVVSLAANNSPSTVTLAGDEKALQEIALMLESEGVFQKMLDVEIPYHSPLMEPLKDRLNAALQQVSESAPTLPLYSTVTGRQVHEASFGADYWPENIREPVEFEKAIRGILDDGYNTFVEVGPHPVLSSALRDCIQAAGKDARLIHTLRRNLPDESHCIYRAVMGVHAAGCQIDWQKHVRGQQLVSLPNYAWQRELHWSENDRAAQDRANPIVYPILGTQETLAAPVWRNDFDHEPVNYLRDHVVAGMPILPAAGYLEALLELASIQFPDACGYAVRDVEILRPAILMPDRGLDFTTTYDSELQRATQRSLENGKLGIGAEHLTAKLAGLQRLQGADLDLEQLRSESQPLMEVREFYGNLQQVNLSYGPYFQTVQELRKSMAGDVVARVEVDERLTQDLAKYKMHPTMLDGCFQALMAMLDSQDVTYLPTHIEEFVWSAELPAAPKSIWCIGRMVKRTSRQMICDLTILNESGQALGAIRGLRATAAPRAEQRLDKFGDVVKRQVLQYQWDYGENPSEPKRLGHWLAIGDAGETSEFISSRLEGFGATLRGRVSYGSEYAASGNEFEADPESGDHARRVLQECGQLDGVVFFTSLDEQLIEGDPTYERALGAIITFTQAMLEIPVADRPRVYVVTQGAFDIEDQDTGFQPGAASVNGWVRVACCELPGFRFSTIDINDKENEDELSAVALELVCDEPEDEVALREEWRFVSVLRESGVLSDDVIEPKELTDNSRVRVRPLLKDAESVGTVRVVAAPNGQCGPREICIRVSHALLPINLIQDQSSDEIDQPIVEMSGTVMQVGSEVQDLQEGDVVGGFGPAELASHLTGPRDSFYLAPMPATDGQAELSGAALVASLKQVATIKHALAKHEPNAPQNALVELTPLGLAIGKELRRRGVEVTLVTDEPEEVDATTRADFRLCLACSFTVAELVNHRGRFDLLVANLDTWQHELGFGALSEGAGVIDTSAQAAAIANLPTKVATVSRTDVSTLLGNRKQLENCIAEAMGDLSQGLVEALDPLEIPLHDIAWKRLPLGETQSSLVIAYEAQGRDLPIVQQPDLQFHPDATYLITGGFGGFGQKTAHWLAKHGARHLVLTGRSGANTPEKQAVVAELEAQGISVVAAACDTSDLGQLTELFEDLTRNMPPVRGVFHSAAVIEDQPVAETELVTFNKVMRAKALGAWNLHELTKTMELDHFVLYSSLSNQIGNSRQGAYCAANGFLNGLARLRKSMHLPGLSVNWGAISDVGVVAQDEKLEQFLRGVGLRGLPSTEGLELLRDALARKVTQFGVVVIKSWADWARYETLGAKSPRFAVVVAADTESQDNEMKRQLVGELMPLSPTERVDLMGQLIVQIVASVIKSEASSLSVDRPINELGIDSLMATEIQVLFESELGIAISVLELVGDTTIRALAAGTLESLEADIAAASEDPASTPEPEHQKSAR